MRVVSITPIADTLMLPGIQDWLDGQRAIKMVKAREPIGNFIEDYRFIYDRGQIVEVRYP
jgi:hypothetical protein